MRGPCHFDESQTQAPLRARAPLKAQTPPRAEKGNDWKALPDVNVRARVSHHPVQRRNIVQDVNTHHQGLTLAHFSAQHKHLLWGTLGGFMECQ